jgi:hypothetical protein
MYGDKMRERFVGKEEDVHESNEIDSIFNLSTTISPTEYLVINVIFNEP